MKVRLNNIYVALLVGLAYISHRVWFIPNAVVFFNDWRYAPNLTARQLFVTSGAWFPTPDLGLPNIQMNFLPFRALWTMVVNLGGSSDLAMRLVVMIPLAIIGFLAPYFLFKKLTGSPHIGLVIAVFYGSVPNFILRQTNHLFIALVYALAPFVLLLFITALEKNTFRYWLGFSVLFTTTLVYEARISLLLLVILAFYFLVNHLREIGKYWKNLLLGGAAGIGLNAFWLLPVILGGEMSDVAAVANRGLFGNWLFDLPHAMSLVDSAWTGRSLGAEFVNHPVLWYLWIIPVLAWLALIVSRREDRKQIILFALIALTGVFLTKQAAAPIGQAYGWLYLNLPGFNLFRESSKFYLFTTIGYAGLLAYMLVGLKNWKSGTLSRAAASLAGGLIVVISLVNLTPLVTGDLQTLFIERREPMAYRVLENYINRQPDFFRVLWAPRSSWWGTTSIEHPLAGLASMNQTVWRKRIGSYKADAFGYPANVLSSLLLPDADRMLDEASVKYVIIPAATDGPDINVFEPYGGKRELYVKTLDRLPFLKRLDIGTTGVAVYENRGYLPHISGKDLAFYSVNPAIYRLRIRGLEGKATITFREAWHPGWRLYALPDGSGRPSPWRGFGEAEGIRLHARGILLNQNHKETRYSTNQWTIDAAEISKSLPAGYYKARGAGVVDVDLAIFFEPQYYFNLGIIVSLVTLAGCLVYFLTPLLRRRKIEGGDEQ